MTIHPNISADIFMSFIEGKIAQFVRSDFPSRRPKILILNGSHFQKYLEIVRSNRALFIIHAIV